MDDDWGYPHDLGNLHVFHVFHVHHGFHVLQYGHVFHDSSNFMCQTCSRICQAANLTSALRFRWRTSGFGDLLLAAVEALLSSSQVHKLPHLTPVDGSAGKEVKVKNVTRFRFRFRGSRLDSGNDGPWASASQHINITSGFMVHINQTYRERPMVPTGRSPSETATVSSQ